MDCFEILPTEISLEILSRVPAEFVLKCKSVCTNWRNIVDHPSFSKMHFNFQKDFIHDSGKLELLAVGYDIDHVNYLIYYFEYHENHDESTKPIQRIRTRRVNFPYASANTYLVGSCNGLICFSRLINPMINPPSVWICNPIRKECFILPELKRDCRDIDKYSYGSCSFGYVSSTNKFKVVKIYRSQTYIEVYIYTLGSGDGWRNLGHFFNSELVAYHYRNQAGIFANGALYWMNKSSKMIITFDLADEKFKEHLSPPLSICYDWSQNKIGVLDGILFCAMRAAKRKQEGFDIWLLKKKNDMHDKKEQNKFGWTKEFRVGSSELLAYTKNNGVLTCDPYYLNIHDMKAPTSKRILEFKTKLFGVTPHKNTLVSFKELGEKGIKKIESLKN